MATIGKHAVVLGASMGGLLAGRVLADFYDTVTLVERDVLPDGAAQRRGVPQGRHGHGLLSGGLQALDQLFPGYPKNWPLMARRCSKGRVCRSSL